MTPTDELIDRFAAALKEKLNKSRDKYLYHGEPWTDQKNIAGMILQLHKHLNKGDPLDVAAYAAFLWHHAARTNIGYAGGIRGPDVNASEDTAEVEKQAPPETNLQDVIYALESIKDKANKAINGHDALIQLAIISHHVDMTLKMIKKIQ